MIFVDYLLCLNIKIKLFKYHLQLETGLIITFCKIGHT